MFAKICDPSNGGNGIKLNTANQKLIRTTYKKNIPNPALTFMAMIGKFTKIIRKRPAVIAKRILEEIPAALTIMSSLRGFLKLRGFTGTGFAPAIRGINIPVLYDIIIIKGIIMDQNGSI